MVQWRSHTKQCNKENPVESGEREPNNGKRNLSSAGLVFVANRSKTSKQEVATTTNKEAERQGPLLPIKKKNKKNTEHRNQVSRSIVGDRQTTTMGSGGWRSLLVLQKKSFVKKKLSKLLAKAICGSTYPSTTLSKATAPSGADQSWGNSNPNRAGPEETKNLAGLQEWQQVTKDSSPCKNVS